MGIIPAKIIPQWKRSAGRLARSGYSFSEAEREFINSMASKATQPSERQENWLKDLASKAGV